MCLKFYSAHLDLMLGVSVGSQERIMEFDQILPAKPDIYYLKQFILETLCHILALKKANQKQRVMHFRISTFTSEPEI